MHYVLNTETSVHRSGVLVPALRALTPGANGSSAFLSWAPPSEEEPLNFVVEWDSVPARQLQWKQLGKDRRNTSVSGIIMRRRAYNTKLHTVFAGL